MLQLLMRIANARPGLLHLALQVRPLKILLNRRLINYYAEAVPPRPRPFALDVEYTTWRGLTDRRVTGRHLEWGTHSSDLPPLEDVVDLWRRPEGGEIPSFDTSMLFSFFAQWFTDSVLRTDLTDRRLNNSNHEIDFCQLYGQTDEQTRILRSGESGKLRYQMIDGEMYPPYLFASTTPKEPDRWEFAEREFERLHSRSKLAFIFQKTSVDRLRKMFVTGLEHGNSNVGYTLLNVIFLREHNRVCDRLAEAYPDWDDDRLFETARNTLIVQLLRIILCDYIGHIATIDFPFEVELGMAEQKHWYRSNRITLEFDLLYRWHSMVPDKLIIGEKTYRPEDYRSNPQLLINHGIEAFITAASRQRAGRIGLGNTPNFFFDSMPLPKEGATDPQQVDDRSVQERTVEMSRRFALMPMNEYRERFGLERLRSFDELTDDPLLLERLRTLYGSIDRVEWFPGVFAEKHRPSAMLGSLMTKMVAYDAFTHALTNPLIAKSIYGPTTFSEVGQEIIEGTNTLNDVVRRNVRDPASVTASFKANRRPPGSYGLPIIGKLWDTADFLFVSGWRQFFERRRKRYGSTVFRAHLFEPTVIVLDHMGFEPFHHWDERLRKDDRFGWAKPPRDLTGGLVPSVFLSEPAHAQHKSLYLKMLQSQAGTFKLTFDRIFAEHSRCWESDQTFSFADELERLAATFVFEWYFEGRPDVEDVRFVYKHIFTHFAPTLVRPLPWSRHAQSRPMIERMIEFIMSSKGFARHWGLAEDLGLADRKAVAHQVLFLTGMNNYLGLQGMSKALIGELSRHPNLLGNLCQDIEALGPEIDLNQIGKLDLLDRFLKEVMRLHPPVFFIYGRAEKKFILHSKSGSFEIEAGEHVMGAIPMAHLDEEVFPQAEVFDPDRFLLPKSTERLIWPHGHHAQDVELTDHTCPGKDIAILYGKLLIVSLLKEYKWELEEAPKWDEHRYSLNVASPIGKMTVSDFRRRISD